ncbi:MAG: hypothetical protein PHZ11_09175 [Desulfitobacteriaceae bacterium]|nr:hypothetical protein [Desulfitobacteriaceae bacterium]MDD4347034.1 hypothetical protein [Desulfitobacteriaceae bacterium]
MKNWRDEILKHFSEQIPALTIVADPDELLCDEKPYAGLERKGHRVDGISRTRRFALLI